MARNGKTFFFASLLFPKWRLHKIARLYQICRYIDDSADEVDREAAVRRLRVIRAAIETGEGDPELVRALNDVFTSGVRKAHLLSLLEGAEFDVSGRAIETDGQFIQYCYWVAGVVGRMMCPLLGTRTQAAEPYAVDLGIAMQITNICRDVLEDAMNGRFYLPLNSGQEKGLVAVIGPGATPSEIKNVVRRYLDWADEFYFSSRRGLAHLPFRCRVCIVLAGELYRQIGVKIRTNDYEVLSGRTYLGLGEKLVVAIGCLRFLFSPSFWRTSEAPAISKREWGLL